MKDKRDSRKECPSCLGTGKIAKDDGYIRPGGFALRECRDCGGSGKVS